MIKRILVVASCVALLVCVFALPASAAVLDYNDYITNIQVDGDNDIVTVSLPASSFYCDVYVSGVYQGYQAGGNFSIILQPGAYYSYNIYSVDYLLLNNIPDGAFVSVVVGFQRRHDLLDYSAVTEGASFLYSPSYSRKTADLSFRNDFMYIDGVLEREDSTSFTINYALSNVKNTDNSPVALSINVVSYKLTMTISSLYRLQQQTGQTNVILKEVEKQLADQGKTLDEVLGAQKDTNEKLDQIINGNNGFDSSGSDFGSQSDELAGAGNQMGGAMNDGMASLGSMVNSASFATTLTTLSSLVNVVFTGHEIEICGIKGNPFMILATVLSVAVLLPLGLKFIFRKWGDNSSGGE